jgi:membrane associated rhomboid family serine protease
MSRPAKLSVPSIVAGICAVLIFATEGFDFVLGIAAAIFGVIGAVLALQPSIRGGLVSMFSLVVGVGSLLVSVLQVVF